MADLMQRLRNVSPRDSGYAELSNEAADRIAALEAKLAEARNDAERYRWLRNVSVNEGAWLPDNFWRDLGDMLGDDFDEAIDAAREGREG